MNATRMLDEFPRCPLCDSDDRAAFTPPEIRTNAYSDRLAAAAGVSVARLHAAMPLWQCRRCQSIWHDPWVSRDVARWLYAHGQPLHRAGWVAARCWMDGDHASFVATRSLLWRLVRDRMGGAARYAELACPFGGLALDEAQARGGDAARSALVSRYDALRASTAEPSGPLDCGPGVALGVRTLLVTDSPMCWGETCRSADGVHCRALARSVFDRTMSLDDAERSGERFDLIGSFLTLDHMPDPNRTLGRLLALGERVMLELHSPHAPDLQHLYAINPRFLDMLRATAGVHVREITALALSHGIADPPLDSRWFLLSRSDDLSWADPHHSRENPVGGTA